MQYDLAVIGSGPAGQKAAVAAAKLGKRAVVVDGQSMLGGVCLHTGTIPSKTLREAVLHLSGLRQRAFYGEDYRVKQHIRIEDLRVRVDEVIRRQHEVVQDQLRRNGIDMVDGFAAFRDPHTLAVTSPEGEITLSAEHVLIACGTRPARREDLPFDNPDVRDADQILQSVAGELARSTIVVGAGVIGLEYVSMMAALEIEVTVIEARDAMLGFVDEDVVKVLVDHLKSLGVKFLLGETVASVDAIDGGGVTARLSSGRNVEAQRLLYAVGRQPNTDRLNLDAIGLPVDSRGRVEVDQDYRTSIPHIYAAGDVIGFPALAATSMEQGRIAACRMFGEPCEHHRELLPYGIYTIPEISTVGRSEQELRKAGEPYVVGVATYDELARAQIMGDRAGLLKLLIHRDTQQILGVAIVGEGASELVHIGLAAMAAGARVTAIRDMVFNYPTLAEAYKVAAMDGINRLTARVDGDST